MLYPMSTLLSAAAKSHTAVPAFNIYNLETVEAVARGSQKSGCPVIFAFGESYLSGVSLPMVAAMVNQAAAERGLVCALHLDHAKKPETVLAAMEAGFSSVMFDGSALSLAENIRTTAGLVREAHRRGVSVEGELGYLNPEDGSGPQPTGKALHTTVRDAAAFVQEAGVDALAIAVGNAHGVYKSTPELNLERIGEIARAVGLPLVLHGCSGIPAPQLRRAIALGVCKVNVNTELALAGAKAILALEQPGLRLEKAMTAARAAMEQAVLETFDSLREEAQQ